MWVFLYLHILLYSIYHSTTDEFFTSNMDTWINQNETFCILLRWFLDDVWKIICLLGRNKDSVNEEFFIKLIKTNFTQIQSAVYRRQRNTYVYKWILLRHEAYHRPCLSPSLVVLQCGNRDHLIGPANIYNVATSSYLPSSSEF